MKISEQLKAAKALITDPANHLQNGLYAALARPIMDGGESAYPWEDGACKFCSIGAIAKVEGVKDEDELHNYHIDGRAVVYLDRVVKSIGNDCVADYNDKKPHNLVMSMWDKAIALAESEGN